MNILRRLALAVALMIAAISPLRADPQAIQMLNAMRAQQGVAPLSYAPRLEAAARAHALDMARHGYFAHTGRDGSGVGGRVRAQGYRWCYVAENLAKGQGDLTQVMRGWAQSAPHYRNMMSRNATGFGLFQGPDRIWAMVLAAPC
ncbi:CAP domain-containing protein [uncultured Sulfitobacter sp.]|uniref:CAP domain-containing protein n=1 Tax=uncultured Sulfitobacter sp. TaxID=191468 RepID=UPI002592AA2A|nr:CAP domain-containing protein [uncultured Sulfitobacter sp.]